MFIGKESGESFRDCGWELDVLEIREISESDEVIVPFMTGLI